MQQQAAATSSKNDANTLHNPGSWDPVAWMMLCKRLKSAGAEEALIPAAAAAGRDKGDPEFSPNFNGQDCVEDK
ncbi:hypothetical protein SAMD00023353_3600380 [Rosellinia necatrix]|uniref:Uncharacterized protein n=1 Tax=Rosellinia necatrix TaxID=77044 RepID=A0A1S8A943_ROSNE|nr:hypothetical protein SAMD00023353_3600380 [Rosellinia necatrix]